MDNPVGYFFYEGQRIPEPKPGCYNYVTAKNGVFKTIFSAFFDASVCVAQSNNIAGLERWFDGVVFKLPKIPYQLLHTVLAHARKAGDGGTVMRPIEQMYHFHYIGGRWRVAVPDQHATPGRVYYSGGDDNSIVLDLHSHHGMKAYFSDTDNKDELGCRFYAVIGKIYDKPEIVLRFGLYGDFLRLPVTAIFDGCMIKDLGGDVDDGY